jgi:hypothetical protein
MEKEALWDVMPGGRKLALLGGWALLLALPWLRRRAVTGDDANSPVTPVLHAPTLETGE